MSHIATAWAVSVRGLSAGEFRVLLNLADCHNPDRGCFPSQTYLRESCEMSNGALNSNLNKLEGKGLIQRHKRGNRSMGGRSSTHYILCMDAGLTPETGVKVNSGQPETTGGLTPENEGVNSGQPETEPVREPVNKKEPVKSASENKQSPKDVLAEVASEGMAENFVAYRAEIKKPMTSRSAVAMANKLRGHPNPDAVLNESIANGWQGVFPEKVKSQNPMPRPGVVAAGAFGNLPERN